MGPRVATQITHHTLWQALTGQSPPLALGPWPVPHAGLDSRDVTPGDLFIACKGQGTDGNDYVGAALEAGAGAVICEPQGMAQAEAQGALVVDCRTPGNITQTQREKRDALPTHPLPTNAWEGQRLAFVVENSTEALQHVGAFHRTHGCAPKLKVVGITGSVGKTSTKELTAYVLSRRFATLHNQGNLNSEQGLPLTLLGLSREHERAVLEMGMYARGEIHLLCTLARPTLGVITNVGPSHLSRLGAMEEIARAKGELVRALPDAEHGGVAILNWDDEWVRGMADTTSARIFRYGLTPDSDLWADEIESAGLEGIRFRFHRRIPRAGIETVHVRVPLLGRHSVHTALRSAAVGLVEGLSWEEILGGMQDMPGQLRLVMAPAIHGATLIDDTYNASPASSVAALNLLQDLEPGSGGRRVAVLGGMLELGSYTHEGHKLVGRRAADVVDLLVTVGELGAGIASETLATGFDPARVFQAPDDQTAIEWLRQEIRQGDLVLVKGSRAVGMERVASALTVAENSGNQSSSPDMHS